MSRRQEQTERYKMFHTNLCKAESILITITAKNSLLWAMFSIKMNQFYRWEKRSHLENCMKTSLAKQLQTFFYITRTSISSIKREDPNRIINYFVSKFACFCFYYVGSGRRSSWCSEDLGRSWRSRRSSWVVRFIVTPVRYGNDRR